MPLASALRAARWVAVGSAMLAVVFGFVDLDRPAGAMAAAMVVVLVAAPMARVAWFARRWATRGDPRFAMVAGAVLVLPFLGFVISVATS